MIKFASALILAVLVAGGSCSGDNTTVGDLPSGIIEDILAIFTHGVLNLTANCFAPKQEDITLLLYNRTHNDTPIAINASNPIEVDASKKIVVIIHGWWAGPDSNGIPKLIQAYLERYDCNVIVLDWTKFTYQVYGITVCSVKGVSQIIADFLCLLSSKFGAALNETTLAGHSIGAQMSGYIGAFTNKTCNASIGTIIGLDPAGPGYQGNPISERLDETDALFVQIIHTNQLQYGYTSDCGDVDFYVNCALLQPGCLIHDIINILETTLEVLNCSHMRSIDYYAESISSTRFQAVECLGCPLVCLPKPLAPKRATMGENCSRTARGGFLLTTNAVPPYAKG